MKVAGFPKVDFNTSSTSAWGNVRMRVALVLDVTGSMARDGKMTALKPAAKALIDQLGALAKNPGDVYISIIPFAKDVNVGASNYTQSWINWSDWDRRRTGATLQREPAGGGANLDAEEPQHLERLRHRPRSELRHQEHDADRRRLVYPDSTPSSTTPAPHS